MFLRGRAACCGAPIWSKHPAAELAALAGAAWAGSVAGSDRPRLWAGCVLGWTLLALSWIEAERMPLPDVLTLGLLLTGLAMPWVCQPWALFDQSVGAAAGFLPLRWGLLHRRLREQEGLGRGDAKLLAGVGAWVGWQALPLMLLGAALFGIAIALLCHESLHVQIAVAFGPGLALAGWLAWLYRMR